MQTCKYCHSDKIVKHGMRANIQRYLCKDCHHHFYDNAVTRAFLNGYVINYTFCQKHQSIGKTPTEAAGLKIKGWKQLIEAATVQKAGGKIEEKQIIEEVLAR